MKDKFEKVLKDKVEESIRKKFHREIFSKFCQAINRYKLLEEGDSVAVCISGGKDSMLMAMLFEELKRHRKFEFKVKYLVMDPGYNRENRAKIEQNAKNLGLEVEIFETDIFSNVVQIDKSPCYICARMRRGHLYNMAKQIGCNKIALGHHFDDVIETILMGMLYGGQVQTMMPKVKSSNFEGMELIRPMYLVREKDIESWRDYNGLEFLRCACKFTEMNMQNEDLSKRKKIKELIKVLKKENPQVEANIFKSVENVNLSTVICYKDKQGKKHNFLEDYN